ncbi:hypothetical protein ACFORL_10175 [Legionella dresdenensis]|uniref:Protein kinase domain-containing protein n=1 Tax=Legionella dresdenensis TaxID=450200 RepID=A0ABV8CGU1_9GAMM
MPKYTCSTEDEDSSYESDDDTTYYPVDTAQYKLVEYIQNTSSNRCIQIQPTLKGLNYFLSDKNKIQSGHIAFEDLSTEVANLQDAIINTAWFKTHSKKIIDIILNRGHGRKGYLATGTYSVARLFSPKTPDKRDNRKTKVVLSPVKCDYRESRKKYHFFESLYPQERSFYLEDRSKETYRMVLPYIPGTLYGDLSPVTDFIEQIKLFLATVKALKECHSKKIICLDLNLYNIKYLVPTNNKDMGCSYLIDGGFSNASDQIIDTEFFKCETQEKIAQRIIQCDHIAPECWYINTAPTAQESMDIYSMGKILTKILTPLSPELAPLIEGCCQIKPDDRYKLDALQSNLEDLLQNHKTYSL